MLLKIEKAPVLPGMRAKSFHLPCSSVSASGRFHLPTKMSSMADRVEEERRRKREHEFLTSRILTMPFRQAAYWIRKAFKGLQDVLFDEQYIFFKVKGTFGTWKMNRTPACKPYIILLLPTTMLIDCEGHSRMAGLWTILSDMMFSNRTLTRF